MKVKVKALPVHQGPAAWDDILPARDVGNPLTSDLTCDWLVIGAGFAGLSAARRLTQLAPSDKVVVIDAGTLATSACGRNSGFMIDLPHSLSSHEYGGSNDHDFKNIRLNRAGMAFARDVADELQMPKWVFNPCGKINAAASAKGEKTNRDYAKHLAGLNEASEWIDAQAMKDIAGTDFYRSGLFTPGTVQIQPAAYIRALAGGMSSNVTLYENTPALGWDRAGPDWVVITPNAKITTPKIILATNGHAENFGYFKGRLMHVFTYASMTTPLSEAQNKRLGGADDWGVTPAHPFGATVRKITTPEGPRIVVRSRFTMNPSMMATDSTMAAAGGKHDGHFAKRFPMLGDVTMSHRWGGHLCLSLNEVQAVGEVDDGIFTAVCQNGLGTARGTLAGVCAAEIAVRQTSEEAKILADMTAPKPLPPRPFAAIGANATMMYHEWSAGWE